MEQCWMINSLIVGARYTLLGAQKCQFTIESQLHLCAIPIKDGSVTSASERARTASVKPAVLPPIRTHSALHLTSINKLHSWEHCILLTLILQELSTAFSRDHRMYVITQT